MQVSAGRRLPRGQGEECRVETHLLDNKSANAVAKEDDRSSRILEPILHEQSEKMIAMFDEARVFFSYGKAIIPGEEHDSTTLLVAAGKDISGPELARVAPGVFVHKVLGLDVEAVNGNDAETELKIQERVSKRHRHERVPEANGRTLAYRVGSKMKEAKARMLYVLNLYPLIRRDNVRAVREDGLKIVVLHVF